MFSEVPSQGGTRDRMQTAALWQKGECWYSITWHSRDEKLAIKDSAALEIYHLLQDLHFGGLSKLVSGFWEEPQVSILYSRRRSTKCSKARVLKWLRCGTYRCALSHRYSCGMRAPKFLSTTSVLRFPNARNSHSTCPMSQVSLAIKWEDTLICFTWFWGDRNIEIIKIP